MAFEDAGAQSPLILAFDTSAAQCAAALVRGREILARRIEPMARGQAERLLPLLEDCLGEAGLGWRDLGRIAVCTGPGNFTGVRLSVAAARGLALSTGLPAMGVSVFEAYAAGTSGPVLALARNPRGAPHAQLFEDGRALTGHLGGPEGLGALAAETLCIGHGAQGVAENLGLPRAIEIEAPRPEWIAFAALGKAAAPEDRPAPLYLRPPDAAPSPPPPPFLDET